MNSDRKRDSFYKNASYTKHFQQENARIDPYTRHVSQEIYQSNKNTNANHHRTALLDDNYRNIYRKTDG